MVTWCPKKHVSTSRVLLEGKIVSSHVQLGPMTHPEEYMRMNRDLDEEPANLQRWKAWLSLVFLVLITGPAVVAFFLTAQEYVDPLVRLVGPEDSQQVNEIFFGGNPWLISCVTEKTAHKKPPRVLEAAAEVLRPRGVRVARVSLGEDGMHRSRSIAGIVSTT